MARSDFIRLSALSRPFDALGIQRSGTGRSRSAPSAGNGGGPGLICKRPVERALELKARKSREEIGTPPPQVASARSSERNSANPCAADRSSACRWPSPRRPCHSRPWRQRRRTRRSGRRRASPATGRRAGSRAAVRRGRIATKCTPAAANRSSRDQSRSLWPYRPM